MEVYEFIKCLTLEERQSLAREIKTTTTYLNYLASKKCHLSVKLANKIYKSNFNEKRPLGLEFSEDAYVIFRQEKSKSRGAKNALL